MVGVMRGRMAVRDVFNLEKNSLTLHHMIHTLTSCWSSVSYSGLKLTFSLVCCLVPQYVANNKNFIDTPVIILMVKS